MTKLSKLNFRKCLFQIVNGKQYHYQNEKKKLKQYELLYQKIKSQKQQMQQKDLKMSKKRLSKFLYNKSQ